MKNEYKNGRYSGERITKNFSMGELTHTNCGLPNEPDEKQKTMLRFLARNYLQPLRDRFGRIDINSAFRTPEVNKAVGGVKNSAHMQGLAADINIPSLYVACQFVAFFIERFTSDGWGFDQLIISHRRKTGNYWLHLGVAEVSTGNRLQVKYLEY